MFFIIRFFIKLFFFFFLTICFVIHYLKAENPLYNSDFYKIEVLCKDVINDFEVLCNDPSHIDISLIQKSSYITHKIMALQEAICNLVENEAEARLYLTEDYEYLGELFSLVEEHFYRWHNNRTLVKFDLAVGVCLQRMLVESKKNLVKMRNYNKEIAGETLCFNF